jgi:ribosomal protein S14
MVPLKLPVRKRLNVLAQFAREAWCAAIGHRRSSVVAFESGGVWHSICQRCGRPLRREAAKFWQEITSEEMTRAQINQPPDNEAPRPGSKNGDAGRPPGYSAAYLARKYGLSRIDAREIIARVGNDRAKLNAAAKLKALDSGRTKVARRPLPAAPRNKRSPKC